MLGPPGSDEADTDESADALAAKVAPTAPKEDLQCVAISKKQLACIGDVLKTYASRDGARYFDDGCYVRAAELRAAVLKKCGITLDQIEQFPKPGDVLAPND